ncbi:zeta toxin family protein [Streptomyces sp. NPDC006863]|uniref:zeta toxin family protein n=1 Tax=Streptomyces sp. NPDC006863 TaxID=3154779 RepID=UPI0033C44E58
MIDPARVEQYRLPQQENERVFYEEIVPDLFADRVGQETPTVVFLIGQPGAGKSRVTEMVAEKLNRQGGFADIDSDLYKPYHPAYDDLMAEDDTLMAAYTRADGRAWMALAEEYVRSHGLNAVIQETSQNPEAVADKMRAYRANGFRVEALFMGVSKAESDQGVCNRYATQRADGRGGRLTVRANADESFHGIPILADLVDRDALAHQSSVFRRGEGEPRYSNSLDASDQWTAPPATRENVDAERSRPLPPDQSRGFADTQILLRALTDIPDPEWPDRLDEIERNAAPLLRPADARRLSIPARPSAAAARSRSTTARKPAAPQPGTSQQAGPGQQPPPHRPEGPQAGRGRSR